MTKKRRNQLDPQLSESSKVPAKKKAGDIELPNSLDASTSKHSFDPRKSYANFIKDQPRKLKFLRKQTLLESSEASSNKSGYVSNWYTSIDDNPSFHTLPIGYSTADAFLGSIYNGEKEIDRLDRFFNYSKRNEHEVEEQVRNHRHFREDLMEAERVFDELSKNDGRLASVGSLVDKIGWKQLPSKLVKRMQEDSIKQTYNTIQMSTAELQTLLRHETLNWMDNYDILNPPGRPIFSDIENPRFGLFNPPIPCCIFTKHRNGQISRCIREPIKVFSLQLCSKVVKKSLPFVWDKKMKVPAICAFHSNVIDKEPKNTEFNPFFERSLGRHEKIEPVRFTEKSQYEQLAKFIDTTLQREKEEHVDAMSFDLRFIKLLNPPKSGQPMQEIRTRQLFENGIVQNGKSAEELEECYERAVRRRNELRNAPKCPYKTEQSDYESDEFELPSSTDEWQPKQPKEPGPAAPTLNSLVGDNLNMVEDERILYKASELGILEMNESPLVEAAERYKSLLDVQAFDNDSLRVFGGKLGGVETPSTLLNFDAISAASIRRIKKHYNLPNRSGATSKALLIEGLNDYFTNKPVDEVKVTQEFIAIMCERQKSKLDNRSLLYDGRLAAAKKFRQPRKLHMSSDLKYMTETVVAESSSSASPRCP